MTKAKKKEEKVEPKKIPGTSPTLLETEAVVEMKTISDKFKEIGLPPIGDVMALSANGRRLAEVIKEREGVVEKIPKVVVEGKTITDFRKVELDRKGRLNINGQDYHIPHLGHAFGRLSGNESIPPGETVTFFLFTWYDGSNKLGYFLMDENSELILDRGVPIPEPAVNRCVPLTVLISSRAITTSFSGGNLLINTDVKDGRFKDSVVIGDGKRRCVADNVIIVETFVKAVRLLPPGRYARSRIVDCDFDVVSTRVKIVASNLEETNFQAEELSVTNSYLVMSHFEASGRVLIRDCKFTEANGDICAENLHLLGKFYFTKIEDLTGSLVLACESPDQFILYSRLAPNIVFGIDVTREELVDLIKKGACEGREVTNHLLDYVVDTVISRLAVIKMIQNAASIVSEVVYPQPYGTRRDTW